MSFWAIEESPPTPTLFCQGAKPLKRCPYTAMDLSPNKNTNWKSTEDSSDVSEMLTKDLCKLTLEPTVRRFSSPYTVSSLALLTHTHKIKTHMAAQRERETARFRYLIRNRKSQLKREGKPFECGCKYCLDPNWDPLVDADRNGFRQS